MPPRTQLFQQLPWIGGVNTSQDDSLIPPNQLVQADNLIFDTKGSRKKREGIKYNFDNQTAGASALSGIHEYWFGTADKTRRFVGVKSNSSILDYSTGGTGTVLGAGNYPWTGTTDQISFLTFNNRCLLATNGNNNLVKIWNGVDSSVSELKARYGHTVSGSGRSSTGFVRTIVLEAAFKGVAGDFVIVSDGSGTNGAAYNGTFIVDSVSTTNVSNDTITYTASTSVTEPPQSDLTLRVDGAAPQASILREHLGRVWCNDKTNKDRLHYSGAFNHELWLGFGDSAAIDIGIGDGDPEGITAIFPTFKGELFVAKRTKLYRISGTSPETFMVSLVSSGIGCISHNAIAQVDQDDMFFVSEKGIHTISATANFGDFNATYISEEIQETFNTKFSKPRLKYCQAGYLPTINSVAFTFTDTNLSPTDNTTLAVSNSVWLFNIPFKAWYRWPDVPCTSLLVASDPDRKRFYFGSHTGRLLKSLTSNNYDESYTGTRQAIKYKVVTGQISIDGSMYTVKGFKRFLLFYKPDGASDVNVTIQIDAIPIDPDNILVFNETPLATLLGVDFILGQSVLGASTRLSSYTRSIVGFGRSVKISIEHDSIAGTVDVQGIGVEFEPAGTSPEVTTGSEED